MGNEFLFCNDLPDNFTHEVAIVVEYAPEEFAVISPCSHNGILNILEECREWIGKGRIKHFIGGLHYVDYLLMGQGEKEAAPILETARILKEKYPYLTVHTGHCTCTTAAELLSYKLGNKCSIFCCGYTIELI